MRAFPVLLVLAAALAACQPSPASVPAAMTPDPTATMDAALRQHLATVSDTAVVDVLVGTGAASPEDARRGLEAAGLDVRTLAGDVAVARGVRAAIVRAAGLPFVRRIDLSQDRSPSDRRP